jgi:hypothetical protein
VFTWYIEVVSSVWSLDNPMDVLSGDMWWEVWF